MGNDVGVEDDSEIRGHQAPSSPTGCSACKTELKSRRETVTEIILLGLSQLKIQEALTIYKRGLVSIGRAAEIAGLAEDEMVAQARAANIAPRWDEQMVREELA